MHNAEELIFYDDKLKKLLPEFDDLFRQWAFTKQYTGFRQLNKRTVSDLLNSIQQEQLDVLEKYLGTKVTIDKLDYKVIKNMAFDINDDIELQLNNIDDFNLAIHRDENSLFMTFWR